MPVNIDWTNADKMLIRYEFVAPWTWEEFDGAARQMQRLLGSVDHPVCLVNDFRGSPGVPGDFMWRLRRLMASEQPANLDTSVMIIIGPSGLVRSVMESFARIYQTFARGRRFLLADTLEEAHAQFAQLRH